MLWITRLPAGTRFRPCSGEEPPSQTPIDLREPFLEPPRTILRGVREPNGSIGTVGTALAGTPFYGLTTGQRFVFALVAFVFVALVVLPTVLDSWFGRKRTDEDEERRRLLKEIRNHGESD